jgi:hypothetical protein
LESKSTPLQFADSESELEVTEDDEKEEDEDFGSSEEQLESFSNEELVLADSSSSNFISTVQLDSPPHATRATMTTSEKTAKNTVQADMVHGHSL